MAKFKKKTDAVTETASPTKGGFLANLTKRTGITVVPVTELLDHSNFTYIDTGSFSLNALISAKTGGGIPTDTIVGIAGEHATGKTYICLSIVKEFLDKHADGLVFYWDTEHAVRPEVLIEKGIPEDRFFLKEVNTIEQFRYEAIKVVNDYAEYAVEDRPPILFVLDSLGNISTLKEIAEAEKELDNQAKDMTRAQGIRSVFRVLAIKLGQANVPLLVTNHVGVKIGGFTRPGAPPAKEMSGGEGLKYAASTVIFLSKTKIYNDKTKEYTGNILTAKLYKSRHTLENLTIQTKLDYKTGMDRYYGLFDVCKDLNIVEKSGNGFKFPGGKQFFTKDIEENPEEFFTDDVMVLLNAAIDKGFRYGQGIAKIEEAV